MCTFVAASIEDLESSPGSLSVREVEREISVISSVGIVRGLTAVLDADSVRTSEMEFVESIFCEA